MDEPTALMPPVSSRSLDEIVREKGPLSPQQAVVLLAAVAKALVKAIQERGASTPLSLPDIRVSRLDEGDPVVILTENEGTVDLAPGADSHSLGVVAFTVLVGRPPRLDETLADEVPTVPARIDRLVGKLLSRDASERPTPAEAHRQFEELIETLSESSVKAASPLSAPPQIKRGPPIGELRTDAKAWAIGAGPKAKNDQKTLPLPLIDDDNPFSDDEATATVQGPLSKDTDDGDSDEATELQRETGLSATYRRPGFRTGDRAPLAPPLAPPVPTPAATPAVSDDEPFVAAKADLMGAKPLAQDAKAPPRRVTRAKPPTALEQLVALANKQPPWVWGVLGVALAFLVLLLIALAR